jgi:hypothetical protein
VLAAALPLHPDSGLGGKLLYAGAIDDASRHLLYAANIAGAASLAASADAGRAAPASPTPPGKYTPPIPVILSGAKRSRRTRASHSRMRLKTVEHSGRSKLQHQPRNRTRRRESCTRDYRPQKWPRTTAASDAAIPRSISAISHNGVFQDGSGLNECIGLLAPVESGNCRIGPGLASLPATRDRQPCHAAHIARLRFFLFWGSADVR